MPTEKKLCVIFPGLGYHKDKPLLYYAAKLAKAMGYEILNISYTDMPTNVFGNAEMMRIAFERALTAAEEQLCSVPFENYQRINFIGKSIGTVVGSAYAKKYQLNASGIWYTPIAETFDFEPEGIAFHGTADPWADTQIIIDKCREHSIRLYLTRNANHSLETGDAVSDISELGKIMRVTREFIQ